MILSTTSIDLAWLVQRDIIQSQASMAANEQNVCLSQCIVWEYRPTHWEFRNETFVFTFVLFYTVKIHRNGGFRLNDAR